MAEVEESNNSIGIKLFGATILLKEIRSQSDQERKKGDDDDDNDNDDEVKRPEKIIPCPRCKSMETKFCYFNNYNVNQPRHFCKGCQRYWTAGGALRNVPVGAGRRKNKPSDGCMFDASSAVAFEEWRAATEHGGYGQIFPAKRRRCAPNSQSF